MARSDRRLSAPTFLARTLIRIASAAVLVVVLGGVLGYLVLHSAAFGPLRAALVERVLASMLGAPVVIDGPVDITLGRTLHVTASDIHVDEAPDESAAAADHIGHGEIRLRVRSLLAGHAGLTALTLSDVTLTEHSALLGMDRVATGTEPQTRWTGIVPGVIRLARRAQISISDVRYAFNDSESGWVFDVGIADLSNRFSADGQSTAITASAAVNGTPLTLTGEIGAASADDVNDGDAFTATITTPGGTVKLRNVLSSDPGAELGDVSVKADITSIGDTLGAFRIARTIEGTSSLTTTVDTTGGVLAVRNLEGTLTIDNGPIIRATGDIDDIVEGTGYGLDIDATLPAGVGKVTEDGGLVNFQVHEISARFTGDVGALEMRDGWISTNLFSDAIPWLGPISADGVRRDAEGRIAVDGLRILAGPADARTLDLTGDIGDLLALANFRLAGDIAVPVADLLRMSGGEGELGRLTGKFAISDASGEAGVDTLQASIAGSDLVSATVAFKADQTQATQSANLDVAMNVPDYGRLASALKIAAVPLGRVNYEGHLSLSPKAGSLDGRLSFGQTAVAAKLAAAPDNGRPSITGSVDSPELVIADLRNLYTAVQGVEALRMPLADEAREPGGPRTAQQPDGLRPHIDITVNAGKVDAADGKDVSGLSGRFLYDDGLASAQSVRLGFLGGRFDFDGSMKVLEAARPFSVNGRMERWPLADVFKEFDIALPLTGTLAASFDLSSTGTSVQAAISDANGSAVLRLIDGVIEDRMFDLTGLVLPSWLTAPSTKSGVLHVECFSANTSLAPGVADLRRIVIETDDVVVTAAGRIDFKNDTIAIAATPKALHPNLIPIVTPFEITGSLAKPKVVLEGGGVAGRAVAEALALPLNALGTLMGVDRARPGSAAPIPDC